MHELAQALQAVAESQARENGSGAPPPVPQHAPLPQWTPTPRPTTKDEARLERLVACFRAGDVVAFEDLYRLTRDDVARTLWRLLGRRSDLDDLLQETYLQLFKSLKTYRGDAKVRTFLYRVCANVALMHLRWWRRRPEEPWAEVPEELSANATPEQAAQAAQASRLVQRALSTLPAKKRIVFVYHEVCGLMPEEIAEAVDAPVNTVRSRLHHARLDFTKALTDLVRRDLEVRP